MIAGFEFGEKDARVFRDEFASRLPDRIIDCHNHGWTKECLLVPRGEYAFHKRYKPWTDFDLMEEFTLADFARCAGAVFPEKEVRGMFFGLPFPQVDRERSNAYILADAPARNNGFYYMPGQFEDAGEAESRFGLLSRKGFAGLKPYPDLARADGGEVGLYDMLNRSFLEFADRYGLLIMLHIPGEQRLRGERLRRDLVEAVEAYRRAVFIIAHVGRSFCHHDVDGAVDFLTGYENVDFDTALVNDPLVLEYLFRRVPSGRILYGSDSPLAFCRGKDVCVNNRHYYVSGTVPPWGLGPGSEGLLDLTYYVYEELRAILYAAKAVYGNAEGRHLENIFWNNMAAHLKRREADPAARTEG